MLKTLVALGSFVVFFQAMNGGLAYELIGVGTWSCEAWQDARRSKRSEATEQWALGFLSGAAFVTRDKTAPTRGMAPQEVAEWLDRYCRAHPKETIAHGTESFTAVQETSGAGR